MTKSVRIESVRTRSLTSANGHDRSAVRHGVGAISSHTFGGPWSSIESRCRRARSSVAAITSATCSSIRMPDMRAAKRRRRSVAVARRDRPVPPRSRRSRGVRRPRATSPRRHPRMPGREHHRRRTRLLSGAASDAHRMSIAPTTMPISGGDREGNEHRSVVRLGHRHDRRRLVVALGIRAAREATR